MELSEKFLDATWSKDINGKPKFFIINEAIISKLCILGEDCEPCFEGSTITKPTIQFSFDSDFKKQLLDMMTELKNLIKEGGTPMFNSYAVEIGDALWQALYSYLEATFPQEDCDYPCSKFSIDSIWEDGTQKFVILRERSNSKLYRLNFILTEDGISSDGELVEVETTYVPVSEAPTFSLEEVEKFETERYSHTEEVEEIEICPICGNPIAECTCPPVVEEEVVVEETIVEEVTYSLEEIPEYLELQNNYTAIQQELEELRTSYAALQEEILPLREFKMEAERNNKIAMINSFYMLSDEDKKDVLENIDTYSIDDIEAKLSIICVRNKVSFNLDDNTNEEIEKPTVYNLTDGLVDSTPAWIKSIQSVAKEMK